MTTAAFWFFRKTYRDKITPDWNMGTLCFSATYVYALNPISAEGAKIKIRQLALTDFYWLNL